MRSRRMQVLIGGAAVLLVGALVLIPDDLELNTPDPLPDDWRGINAKVTSCRVRRAVWPVARWHRDAGNHRYAFRLAAIDAGSDRQHWAVVLPERAGIFLLEIDGSRLTSYGPLSQDAPC